MYDDWKNPNSRSVQLSLYGIMDCMLYSPEEKLYDLIELKQVITQMVNALEHELKEEEK